MEKTVRLPVTAGALMLITGVIFGCIKQWLFTALVWAGAFCCFVAALNFKNHKAEK